MFRGRRRGVGVLAGQGEQDEYGHRGAAQAQRQAQGSAGSGSPKATVPQAAVNTQVTVVHTGTIKEARQRWSAVCDSTRPTAPVKSSRYGYGEVNRARTAPAGSRASSSPETPLMASELTP